MSKIYEPINIENVKANNLEIEIDYTLGGMNFFTYKEEKRGIYIYITPVFRGGGWTERNVTGDRRHSGYKILLEELNRRNQKKEEKYLELIKPLTKKITELFIEAKDQEVFDLVTNLKI